ncbi:NADP-dependent glyceraldehyde-3-phosphate dehydrogenase [Spirosoma sp. KCTC 42546]|uniref:NADP-dependent glyceraldehyde-3-phosphate dehydrogenase n=1 Tax=Spirosoma sp. KCTC 42546 TaxID=2520506 RepID=UPI001159F80C|nr:NADP-dependent glyceraldehyde-3-phosphate dehydrogenase [Spirosoma sp. KCTC 42546]QDK79880.1 NADP-dependent glyceraldehyde-3-phosphate dehydrogenase [Spirosoma sp. KCTC 42546]
MNPNASLLGLFPDDNDIPATIRLSAPVHQNKILINGELLPWEGPIQPVYSPIYTREKSGELTLIQIGSYPIGGPAEAQLALQSAVAAFDSGKGEWPSMAVHERIKRIWVLIQHMIRRKEDIVKLIVWEIGKTVKDADTEFERTIGYILDSIKALKKLTNESSQFIIQQNFIGQVKKVPHGVVLCMGPFNYPLNETFTTLIPALLMGNTVLFKPPKQGTLLFEPILEAFAEAFPKGVVNTVYGRGRDIVPTLMQSGNVDVLALIGSSKVADSLKKMHPKSNRLKSILGLDAKNAAIIFSDADIALAVKECVAGALTYNGQRCTALKILFVHARVVQEFNKRLIEEVDKLVVGMPWESGVTITPLAEPDKPAYLVGCIQDALDHGATVLNNGHDPEFVTGSLIKPTVLFPVNDQMIIYRDEQFGPLVPVVPFEDSQLPIDYITQSPYGQQVSLFSQDPITLSVMIDKLTGQVGRININAQCQRSPDSFPFSGRKDSAEGTLSIVDALNAFSVDSVVAMKQTTHNEQLLEAMLERDMSSRLSNRVVF